MQPKTVITWKQSATQKDCTSFAAIMAAMTAPDSYSSLEYMAPEANGNSAAANATHFIVTTMVSKRKWNFALPTQQQLSPL